MKILYAVLKSTCLCFLLFFDLCAVPTTTLDSRLTADLRLIVGGFLDPLNTFMSEDDYKGVLKSSRLDDGTLFPLPFVLPVDRKVAKEAFDAGELLLQDEFNTPLAICSVTEIYEPDLELECLGSLGTVDSNHPYVPVVLSRQGKMYVSGPIKPFKSLSLLNEQEGVLTPQEIKSKLRDLPVRNIVAFQTRNPIHQAHFATIQYALNLVGGDCCLLLHPAIGPTQDEDIPAHVRKKCYDAVLPYFSPTPAILEYLPLSMRMAGPKEALLHAIIRKNCGATHFIVGKDQAGPSSKRTDGSSFYEPTEACQYVKKFEKELGIHILAIPQMFYVEELNKFISADEVTEGVTLKNVSGTALRNKLKKGEPIPEWFSFPEVLKILSQYYQNRQGLCVYFTGPSSCGKSTLAKALKEKLQKLDPHSRDIVMIDGDHMRRYLTPDCGFSKEDRSKNVRRIGFVASLIVESGGCVVCANIAPYEADRQYNRKLIGSKGRYFEVFVDTPMEICEERDQKGLYKKAKEGLLPEFFSYEIPLKPDLRVDGTQPVDQTVDLLIETIFQ